MWKHLCLGTLGGVVLLLGCDKMKESAGSLFGGDFEGEITMNATSKTQARGGPTTLVFGIKKPKYRIDASGGISQENPMLGQGASFILEPVQKKGWLLMPAQKQAIVIDFDKVKNMQVPGRPKPSSSSGPQQPPPKIEKTGKKDVVAGYSCEIWKVTQNDGKKAELCMAEGITWIDLGDMGWSSPEISLATVASEANRFPLRVIAFNLQGAEETRLEATKVDKKKLEDSRFVVPPDYKVMDMSQMFMGMPGMGAPGVPPGGMPPNGMPKLPPGFPTNLPTNRPQ